MFSVGLSKNIVITKEIYLKIDHNLKVRICLEVWAKTFLLLLPQIMGQPRPL